MSQGFFDWSNWIFGLIGVVVGVAGYFGLQWKRSSRPKTKNTVLRGDRNRQEGGEGETDNRVTDGSDNVQGG